MVRALSSFMWMGPIFAAIVVAASSLLARGDARAATPPARARENAVDSPSAIHTRIVSRPVAAANHGAISARDRHAERAREQIGLAFAPPQSMPVLATPTRETVGPSRESARAIASLSVVASGVTYQLAGVEALPSGSLCHRLDGVDEPCERRAADRLAVLTLGRDVVCRPTSDQTRGAARLASCQAGKIDLAGDLVRNGLARAL